MKVPKYHDGKKLKYVETFRSPCPRPTEESARKVLNSIRECHSPKNGWIELNSYIEKTPEGFVAVRNHAMYK